MAIARVAGTNVFFQEGVVRKGGRRRATLRTQRVLLTAAMRTARSVSVSWDEAIDESRRRSRDAGRSAATPRPVRRRLADE